MGQPNRAERVLGSLLEWLIQRYVIVGGRTVDPSDAPWLAGPVGTARIGDTIYDTWANESGLVATSRDPDAGLLCDFASLDGPSFSSDRVHPLIVDFYEHTARYRLDVWPEWRGFLKPFPRTIVYLVSRNIQQLNLPLSIRDASRGMSSEIITLDGERRGPDGYAGWLRRTVATSDVVYAGFYTTCKPPNYDSRCVKVVFPLPDGSATIILRPEHQPDGSFKLISMGRRFGDPGGYRIHRLRSGRLRVRYVAVRETIHVIPIDDATLATHHIFRYGPFPFLELHYRMTRVD